MAATLLATAADTRAVDLALGEPTLSWDYGFDPATETALIRRYS
ncbi:hypothetical protein Athai_57560 [Actinocatenispora thailandica]|uniref:Uncharacterized protein n=1 Tax=Actinocatenispora thailandica TaxID=227318 RepID=A0A7R7HZH2_9ACTN|nr:hypothetical protein [Actinocatenispora thailandica]BCJ38253.1 hypothetical protein Athai_57560 [Actinocatenispora thailandica]